MGGAANGDGAAPASEAADNEGGGEPDDWPRWRDVALELGVEPDEALQGQLLKMASVARATGRELGEPTVRAFLQRRKAKQAA